MPEPKKTAYQLECERTCELCQKNPATRIGAIHRDGAGIYMGQCTAVSRDELIERLSAENAAKDEALAAEIVRQAQIDRVGQVLALWSMELIPVKHIYDALTPPGDAQTKEKADV